MSGIRGQVTAYVRVHFDSLATISVRAFSVLAGFAIAFYIGRVFGPAANGQYALVTQTGMFLSIVAVGGMDQAIVRNFSSALVRGVSIARRTMINVLSYCLAAALAITLVLLFGGPALYGALFGRQIPESAVMVTCVILVARTMTRMAAAVLRSQDVHITGQLVEVLFIPIMVCLFLGLGLVQTLEGVLWTTAFAGIVAAGYGVFRSLRFCTVVEGALYVPARDLFRTSLPLWATAIFLNMADWYGLATAARLLGVYEAGLFRVAYQIGGALSFVAMGMYTVFGARISAAIVDDDFERVAELSRSATRLAVVLVVPVVLVLGVMARPLLNLISPEFGEAAPVLIIILVGQFIYVCTCCAGYILAMSGHQKSNLLSSVGATVTLLVTAPLATHWFGLIGLAVAMVQVPVLSNIANVIAVYRLVRIDAIRGIYFGKNARAGKIVGDEAS